jgi:protein-S-isoprenylcysteine O-methyltransferase Ste14
MVIVLLLVVAALDAGRYQWSRVSLLAETVAWAALAGSCGVIWHVFAVNAFLSSYARIQEDRGQAVVTAGLYGIVRHPMYAAVIVWALALPVALGSLWALLPGSMSAGLLILRTAREDRMLLGQLPGYREYANRVRFRLLAGVW